jgi:hypothetical protein
MATITTRAGKGSPLTNTELDANFTNLSNDNLPSIRPSLLLDFANSKTLDPRIDFTRSSTATYYDGSTFSSEYTDSTELVTNGTFDTDTSGWSTQGSGTITFSSGVATVARNGGVYTNHAYQNITTEVGKTYAATIDISNITGSGTASVVILDNSAIYVNTTSTGSFTFTFTATTTSTLFGLRVSVDGNGTFDVDNISVREVIPVSGFKLVTAAAGAARFDHDPVTGESKGLLIEEQRTNLVNISEDISDASFTTINITKQGSTLIAPDGTLTAGTITSTSGTAGMRLTKTATSSTGVAVTYSIYVKKGNNRYVTIGDRGETTEPWSTFDFDTESITGSPIVTTANSTSVGNGWYRISMTWTKQNPTFVGIVAFKSYFETSNSTPSFTGTGYETIHIWGMQLEAGAFPTSYIPTSGSQVTREGDLAKITGTNFSDWYRQDEGTVYCEFNASTQKSSGYDRVIGLDDTSSNDNKISISTNNSTNQIYLSVYVDGTNQITYAQRLFPIGNSKLSYCYKVNDYAFTGISSLGTVATDTNAKVPYGVNSLGIGASPYSSGAQFNACFKKLAYYPARLTNAEIVALTEA